MPTPGAQLQPIGLDLGTDSIKMLQLEVRAASAAAQGDALQALPPLAVVAAATAAVGLADRSERQQRNGPWGTAVRRMLAEQPFVGRSVVAALPRSTLHVRRLRLNRPPEFTEDGLAKLDATARADLAGLFPFDLSAATVRYLYAGQVRHVDTVGHELIVLAARTTEVEAFVAQLDAAGVAVTSLDCQANALFRSIERFVGGAEALDAQMLVDIGTRQTQVIIGRAGELTFCKTIDVGGMHLLDAVAAKLGITVAEAKAVRQRLLEESQLPAAAPEQFPIATGRPPTAPRRDRVRQAVLDATRRLAEELGRELSLCLRYHAVAFRGRPPLRVRIVGGDADDPQLMSAFTSVLSLPVESAQPLANLDTTRMRPADRAGSASQWALATGLALRFTNGPFATAGDFPDAISLPPTPATVRPAPFDKPEAAVA